MREARAGVSLGCGVSCRVWVEGRVPLDQSGQVIHALPGSSKRSHLLSSPQNRCQDCRSGVRSRADDRAARGGGAGMRKLEREDERRGEFVQWLMPFTADSFLLHSKPNSFHGTLSITRSLCLSLGHFRAVCGQARATLLLTTPHALQTHPCHAISCHITPYHAFLPCAS